MRREYQGAAQAAVLTASLGGSTGDLTITCDDLTGWPTGVGGRPFYIVIDRGLPNEEKILCTSRSGNTLAVFNDGLTTGRGADGTAITGHSNNAVVEHVFTATDADEANAHVNNPALHITAATASTRPSPATANQVILQTDTASLFARINNAWVEVSGEGAQGGASDKVFWENNTNVTASYTITSGFNAGTFGPVTINNGVTVTIPSGSVWSIV